MYGTKVERIKSEVVILKNGMVEDRRMERLSTGSLGAGQPKALEKYEGMGKVLINTVFDESGRDGKLGVARLMYWHKLCWRRNNLANWVFGERNE